MTGKMKSTPCSYSISRENIHVLDLVPSLLLQSHDLLLDAILIILLLLSVQVMFGKVVFLHFMQVAEDFGDG